MEREEDGKKKEENEASSALDLLSASHKEKKTQFSILITDKLHCRLFDSVVHTASCIWLVIYLMLTWGKIVCGRLNIKVRVGQSQNQSLVLSLHFNSIQNPQLHLRGSHESQLQKHQNELCKPKHQIFHKFINTSEHLFQNFSKMNFEIGTDWDYSVLIFRPSFLLWLVCWLEPMLDS